MEPPANACQKRLSVLEPLRSHRDFGRILARPPQSICLAQRTGSFGLPEGCDPAFYSGYSRFFALENHAGPCGSGRLRRWSITAGTASHGMRDDVHNQSPPGRQKSRRSGFFAITRCGHAHPCRAKNPKAPRASADPGSIQDCFAGCEAQHQPADAGQAKTTRCRVFREHSSSSFRRGLLWDSASSVRGCPCPESRRC